MQNNYFISFHFTSLSIIELLGQIYGLYFTSSKDFQVLCLCTEFNVCHARGRATRSRSNFGVPPPYCLQRLIMQHHKVQSLNAYEHIFSSFAFLVSQLKESKRWSASSPWPWILSLLSFLFAFSDTDSWRQLELVSRVHHEVPFLEKWLPASNRPEFAASKSHFIYIIIYT